MLNVKTPTEVNEIIAQEFSCAVGQEAVPIFSAFGRVLAEDVFSTEFVPGFDRSTVDGYAVRAVDTFGCSDAIPAILSLQGRVLMGKQADFELASGQCASVPTGGEVPKGADSMVMVEYSENFGDGTIGIAKSGAPGSNIIFKGDDVFPGKKVLSSGRRLTAQDVGALAAMGISQVLVRNKIKVGIISTGDELVPVDVTPQGGQIRDVNTSLLTSMLLSFGAEPLIYGIVRDEENLLRETVSKALEECDMLLISGGSSVGEKDAACRVITGCGELLLHGIAMKPGKPTILGKAGNKPIFGLPGHPVAAFFVTELFVKTVIAALMGQKLINYAVSAFIDENIGANSGRAEYIGVSLYYQSGKLFAHPIHGKSGLITTLAGTDGYFCIERDCEGVPAGQEIRVMMNEGI